MTGRLLSVAAAALLVAGPVQAQQLSDFVPAVPAELPDVAVPEAEAPVPLTPVAPGEGPTVVLRGVEVDGAVAVPAAELEPLWAALIGTPVDLPVLEALAGQIGAAYRARGFVLSQAFLPPQVIEDGIVRVEVLEGFVDQITVTGGAPNQAAAASRRFAPLSGQRPMRLQALERAVLLSRDLQGGGVETVLEPSPGTFAAADLTVMLDPPGPSGFAALDNRGSRLYGDASFVIGGVAHNLLSLNERIEALVASSVDGSLQFLRLELALPVTGLDGTVFDGTMLEIEGSLADGEPDLGVAGDLPGLAVTTRDQNVRVGLRTPFIRTRAQNLFGHVLLDWQRSRNVTRFGGDAITDRDRLLVLEAGVEWDRADRFAGVTLASARLRQGLDVGGSSVGGVAASGVPDFTLVSARLARLQQLGNGPVALWMEAIGQYAANVLPNSERFSLGDASIGRGFAPGNTTGDSGWGLRAELRRTVVPEAGSALGEAAEFYGFVDYGRAYNRDRERTGTRSEELGSIGVGVRWDVRSWLTITPEIARQIVGQPADRRQSGRETRFYLGAVTRF